MITSLDLQQQREKIQEDILCILDGMDPGNDILTDVCQVVADRFDILIDKLNNTE